MEEQPKRQLINTGIYTAGTVILILGFSFTYPDISRENFLLLTIFAVVMMNFFPAIVQVNIQRNFLRIRDKARKSTMTTAELVAKTGISEEKVRALYLQDHTFSNEEMRALDQALDEHDGIFEPQRYARYQVEDKGSVGWGFLSAVMPVLGLMLFLIFR